MNNDKKVKLFLVDDDAVFSKFLEIELLRRADFAIETYPTGERCVANLSGKPDLIILDYHLANMDKSAMNGMETLDKIKSIGVNHVTSIGNCVTLSVAKAPTFV